MPITVVRGDLEHGGCYHPRTGGRTGHPRGHARAPKGVRGVISPDPYFFRRHKMNIRAAEYDAPPAAHDVVLFSAPRYSLCI